MPHNYGADRPGKASNQSGKVWATALKVSFMKHDVSADGLTLTAYTGNDPTALLRAFTVVITGDDYTVTIQGVKPDSALMVT
jgi:hypothetical protein